MPSDDGDPTIRPDGGDPAPSSDDDPTVPSGDGDGDGPLARALQWILAIALVVGNALKWLLLWPYEVVRTYLAIGEKRREAGREEGEGAQPGEAGPEGDGDDAH